MPLHASNFPRSLRQLALLLLPLSIALAGCESLPELEGSGASMGDGGQRGGNADGDPGNIGAIIGDGDGDGDADAGDGDGFVEPVCGNALLEPGELCDDGNEVDGDGCSANCASVLTNFVCLDEGKPCLRVVTCGNGVLEGNEACDDRNVLAGDGCAADCSEVEAGFSCVKPGEPCRSLPVCGNGLRERGEQCDDAQTTPTSGDGCDAACQLETGFFCVPGQACVPIDCGDGNRTPNEACDDGNDTAGDGCSVSCQIEEGWRCSASGCRPICGNGIVQTGEQCDDGDLNSSDGCSAGCLVEPYFECAGEPSVCTSTIVCGDGVREVGEVCDPCEGRTIGVDGRCALAEARLSACYNWEDHPGQACRGFDSALVDPPVCGNGVVENDEECDPVDPDTTLAVAEGCDAVTCQVTEGFACPKAGTCFRLPECGDGIVQAPETCDAGAMSSLGCELCQITVDYYCSGEPSVCVQSICGDGLVAPDEPCDDGNLNDGDGCSASCGVESGWICPPNSACLPDCGDGVVIVGEEECDDAKGGTPAGACTNCRVNRGWDCNASGADCVESVCGNGDPNDPVGAAQNGESCDDGNTTAGDGCGPTCQLEPTIVRDALDGWEPDVQVTCGDGLRMGSEGCDDGNNTSGDGCSATCSVESGWTCEDVLDLPESVEMAVTYRDFLASGTPGGHEHFQNENGAVQGIVGQPCTPDNQETGCGRLDQQGKAQKAPGDFNTISGANEATQSALFGSWYRDTPLVAGVNVDVVPGSLLLEQVGGGASTVYEYDNSSFFPLDGSSFSPPGNNGHNFLFTTELRYFFQYQGGETLTFRGDDDVWVFINGRLAVDVGGIHCAQIGRVVLGDENSNCSEHGTDYITGDGNCAVTGNPPACSRSSAEEADDTDDRFNITKGGVYEIVLLHAERRETGSNFRLTLQGFLAPRSSCTTTCGDGVRAGTEICDGGSSMPATGYDTCLASLCRSSFCGDGAEDDGFEDCDNGVNADVYGSGVGRCAPGCAPPAFCGDGVVQSAFEVCDDGVNDGSYGGCQPDCQNFAGYCGDGNPNAGEEECDTPGVFTNYAFDEGACRFDCSFAGFCGDRVRNGPEQCDRLNPDGSINVNCNDFCEFAAVCGDGLVSARGGEQCDYGSFAFEGAAADAPYGGCTDSCELGPHCGDEVVQSDSGEECDDGAGNIDGVYDSCTSACILGPRCGDALIQASQGEACDNGFNDDIYAFSGSVDPCGAACTAVPFCGDGVVQSAFEICDAGAENGDTVYDGCTTLCDWGPYCGDGVRNGPEACDDGAGNVAYAPDGNGCSFDCTDDVPFCGDGVRNGPEECDDGADNGTGYGQCTAECKLGPRCGDGVVQSDAGEECDNGRTGSLTCSPDCQARATGPR